MEDFEGSQDGCSGAVFKRFCQDGIAVMVIEDHDVIVSSAGWGGKFTSLVLVNLPQWFDDGGKTGVCFVTIGLHVGIAVGERFIIIGFGGSLVSVALIQMPLMHGHGSGQETLESC